MMCVDTLPLGFLSPMVQTSRRIIVMKIITSALVLAVTIFTFSVNTADAARKRGGGGGSVCIEKGCKGPDCIFCTR